MNEVKSGRRESLLNEEEAISLIWKILSRKKRQGKTHADPYQDDASWFSNEARKRLLIIKTDMFVSETDAPPQMTAKQMGSKALTACVSDFAAKGVRPKFALISLAIPKRDSTKTYVSSLARGLEESSRKYGVKIIGGDTNSSKRGLILSCTIGGFANSLVLRRNARQGELVGVSGRFGLQSAGLRLLLGRAKGNRGFQRMAERTVLNPEAKLNFGLAISKYLTSGIDSSDGLAISLYHIAESSGANLEIKRVPIAKGIAEFAKLNSLNPDDLVFFGGEEYELVFTFKREHRRKLSKMGVEIIGRVGPRLKIGQRPHVSYRSKILPRRGWVHND